MRLPNEYLEKRQGKCDKHCQAECAECSQWRKFYEGIYSWQLAKWRSRTREPLIAGVIIQMVLSIVIIVAAITTGFWISYLVPPGGLSCRHRVWLPIIGAWLVSFIFDRALDSSLPFTSAYQHWHFCAHCFSKTV